MEEEMKKLNFRGGWGVVFLPLITFIISSLYMVSVESLSVSFMITGFVIGLIILMALAKDFGKFWDVFQDGMASKTTALIVGLYVLVGIYAGLMQASGLAGGFVWLGLIGGITGALFTVFTFVSVAIFAVATGTAFGAMIALGFVLYPAGLLLGSNPGFLLGAIFAGAALGDNLGPVSDTTVLSASLQHFRTGKSADIPGVVRSRVKYSLICAVICIIGYFILGGGGSIAAGSQEMLAEYANPMGLFMLIPIVLIIYVAMRYRDIFKAIVVAICSALGVGLVTGLYSASDLIRMEGGQLEGALFSGLSLTLLGMIIVTILFLGLIKVLQVSGALDGTINFFGRFTKSPRSTELTHWGLSSIFAPLTGFMPTSVVLVLAPIVEKMGRKFKLHPYRRANVLDAMACSWSYFLPFSLGILLILGMLGTLPYEFMVLPTPIEVCLGQLYGWSMVVVIFLAALTGFGREFEGKGGRRIKAAWFSNKVPREALE